MRCALVALVTGCSLSVTGVPAKLPTRGPIDCTTSNVLPVFDAIATVGAFAIAAGGDDCQACSLGRLAAVLLGATTLVTSVYGFTKVSECNAANDARRAGGSRTPQDSVTARVLVNRAHVAAVAGDCGLVVELRTTVRALDRDLGNDGFDGDEDIARCFLPAGPYCFTDPQDAIAVRACFATWRECAQALALFPPMADRACALQR
jgi:hypothetical protein